MGDYAELRPGFSPEESEYGEQPKAEQFSGDMLYASIVEATPKVIQVNPGPFSHPLCMPASRFADLSREASEQLLRKNGLKVGSYCIRPSKSHPGSYVLCVAFSGEVRPVPHFACI